MAVDNTIDIVPDEQVDSSVELTPGFIGGTIDLGGQNISRVDLAARGGDFAANRYPASEGPYTLTVNVPTGESLDYTVSATAWMDNYTTRMFFQDQVVSVEEGQTSQLDYRVNSGYIAAELLTNGCTIVHSEMWATREDPGGYSKAMTKRGGEQQYRFPVQPNSAIRVYGQVQLSTGATFQLEEQAVTVSPGQETPVSWEVNCVAGQLSQIQHDVEYHLPMDYHLSYLYRQGSGSPYRVEKHEGSVLFADLAPGDWHLYSYSYWNNHQNLISKRFNNIKTLSGETTGVSFDQYPGFLRGSLALSGTHTIEDTSYAHIYAYGRNPLYPSDQVYSRALANNVDGTFNLALPQGEYSTYVSVYAFYRPTAGDDYLNASLYMYDYSKRNDLLYIDSQEVIEGYDVAYETGSAVIKFRRADGGAFSAPYITAKSYTYDENQVLQSYSYTTSRTLSAADRVTMVGFPGTYEVEAWAYVDGSRTIFGKVEVEIISGVEKVIDLGGPTLTVSEPAAGAVLSEQTLTLSGTATDESGIEAILVNGEAVAFSATDNPEDPYEVSFTTVITLGEGENKITTVASDASGNESTDSRTVTYVPPVAEVVQARMDIKPGSCKNPFNVTEKGVMPVVLLGSAEFDVREIDPASLTLHGVGLLRHAYGDAAEYLADGGCGTDQADGYEDLVLKFKSQAIVAALGAVSDGEVITLELNGTSYEGLELVADDHLTIIKRGRKK
ncbi:Ig-like domain-containing protein [Desulfogranum mediterraneum]|uniref:Ig-like domain-containing protein n=1 Tax=Desulfogranum mediterraneum TaxID=160661 RepID=UPI0004152D92|nr:Ig-like domain-containing protein [Desulfogranum mediterraneum]